MRPSCFFLLFLPSCRRWWTRPLCCLWCLPPPPQPLSLQRWQTTGSYCKTKRTWSWFCQLKFLSNTHLDFVCPSKTKIARVHWIVYVFCVSFWISRPICFIIICIGSQGIIKFVLWCSLCINTLNAEKKRQSQLRAGLLEKCSFLQKDISVLKRAFSGSTFCIAEKKDTILKHSSVKCSAPHCRHSCQMKRSGRGLESGTNRTCNIWCIRQNYSTNSSDENVCQTTVSLY